MPPDYNYTYFQIKPQAVFLNHKATREMFDGQTPVEITASDIDENLFISDKSFLNCIIPFFSHHLDFFHKAIKECNGFCEQVHHSRFSKRLSVLTPFIGFTCGLFSIFFKHAYNHSYQGMSFIKVIKKIVYRMRYSTLGTLSSARCNVQY